MFSYDHEQACVSIHSVGGQQKSKFQYAPMQGLRFVFHGVKALLQSSNLWVWVTARFQELSWEIDFDGR